MTKLITLEGNCTRNISRGNAMGEAPKFAFSLFSLSGADAEEIINQINPLELNDMEAGALAFCMFSNQLKNQNTLGKRKPWYENIGRKTKNACLDFGPTVLTAAGVIATATGIGAPAAPFLFAGAASLTAADQISKKIAAGKPLTKTEQEQKTALEKTGKTFKQETFFQNITKIALPAGIGVLLLLLL